MAINLAFQLLCMAANASRMWLIDDASYYYSNLVCSYASASAYLSVNDLLSDPNTLSKCIVLFPCFVLRLQSTLEFLCFLFFYNRFAILVMPCYLKIQQFNYHDHFWEP